VVYFSDSNNIFSDFHLSLLKSADLIIFNTPEFKGDPHHLGVEDVINLNKKYQLPKIIITHLNHHNYLHQELEQKLSSSPNIFVAYDGMKLQV
jgi:phosphoribosyl 1,2-cyclic phosphodiesterase